METEPPAHETKVASPLVDEVVPTYGLASATPNVSLISIPNSEEAVVEAQNSPKSKPLPAVSTVESATLT